MIQSLGLCLPLWPRGFHPFEALGDSGVFRGSANYLFTSESVSEGHPDKVCDRISDEIVDLYFRESAKAGIDPYEVRVACETLATTNRVVIAGETRGPKLSSDVIEHTARKAIKAIGYEQDGFHWEHCKFEVCCTPNRSISRKVSMPQATRMKAPAIKASCSASPAAKRRS